MIVLPEPTPTEYRLRNVKPNQLSNREHTPFGEPRVTQPSVGKYMFPVQSKDSEYIVSKVPEQILDRWTNHVKELWVPKPGHDAWMMDNIHRKFSVAPHLNDTKHQDRPSIFPRSYKYELECLEALRMQKLENKIYKESLPKTYKIKCECMNNNTNGCENEMKEVEDPSRWQSQPKLFAASQTDPCLRRLEFEKVGQPFKNEACNYYYKHFPAPDIPFKPKKFI